MTKEFVVPHLAAPTRLDLYLVHELGTGWSRSAIQRAIEHGHIKVNDRSVPVHHFLKLGEKITVTQGEPPAQPHLMANPNVQFTVIEQTADYLVINKPSGIVVHPAAGVREPTLADGLIAHYSELIGIGDDPLRPGLVHRLDREVSGLMVVARSQAMFAALKAQFAARQVNKQYAALVIGRPTKPDGTINFPLTRGHGRAGRVAARPAAGDDTRDAITHFEVQTSYQEATLLNITIETGRTHQIRAHLAALGYPIVGDKVYRPKNIAFKSTPGRLFLHATQLEFTDLQGVMRKFASPLPPELTAFLTTLK